MWSLRNETAVLFVPSARRCGRRHSRREPRSKGCAERLDRAPSFRLLDAGRSDTQFHPLHVDRPRSCRVTRRSFRLRSLRSRLPSARAASPLHLPLRQSSAGMASSVVGPWFWPAIAGAGVYRSRWRCRFQTPNGSRSSSQRQTAWSSSRYSFRGLGWGVCQATCWSGMPKNANGAPFPYVSKNTKDRSAVSSKVSAIVP